jgi:hypothetical protein
VALIPIDQLERIADEAAAICRKLVPTDLAQSACYIVPHTFLGWPRSEQFWRQSLAWTSAVLDLKLQDNLRAVGKWRGRGFATIVNDGLICSEPGFFAIALHELCHWLTEPEWQVVDTSRLSEALPNLERAVLTMASRPFAEDPTDEIGWLKFDWAVHGSDFARACVHLLYRAGVHGVPINPVEMRFAKRWGNCQYAPATYTAAIGTEPRDRQEEPLRDILRSPPPADWINLWAKIKEACETTGHAPATC